MKLYIVRLRGLGSATGMQYMESFVLADDPTKAYAIVRKFLDDKDYGFKHERELDSIILVADEEEYSDVRKQVFIQ